MIMTIAGSSAGSEDVSPTLMENPGELPVHGIAAMPGTPVPCCGGHQPRHPYRLLYAM